MDCALHRPPIDGDNHVVRCDALLGAPFGSRGRRAWLNLVAECALEMEL